MGMKRALVAFALIGAFSGGIPAIAGGAADDPDKNKIQELEAKLGTAMALIQQLAAEMAELKANRVSASSAQSAPAITGSTDFLKVTESRFDELSERIGDVEDVVLDVDERVGSRAVVNAFDAKKLDIGGFLLETLTHVDGEDGSATSFNRQVFELLVKAELSDKFSMFVAQAFTREASPTFTDPEGRRSPDFNLGTGAPTPIAWANYRHSDAFNVRVGRWVTPHGIINIDHFPAILLDTEQPQFLRPFGGQTIFANFQTGVQVHGKQFFGAKGSKLDYAFYVGNFGGNQDNFNAGGRLAYTLADTGFTFGINGAFGKRAEGINSDYTLFGADLLYDKGPILWKTEYHRTDEDFGEDRTAFYTQPAWRFQDDWFAFYRYDFLDDGQARGDRREHVLGLTFNPLPSVRLRGTATFRHFDARGSAFGEADARLYQLSTTYSF